MACFFKSLDACCSASGDGFALFGERCGNIFKLSRKLEEYFWVAHKRELSDFALADNVLATVGVSGHVSPSYFYDNIFFAEVLV